MSDASSHTVFGPAEEPALRALLDAIVPPSAERGLPGAGEVDAIRVLDEAAGRSPELAAAIRRGLAALAALAGARGAGGFAELSAPAREELLREVEARDPGFLPGVLFHTYAAYYRHPRVLAGLGLPPRPPHPLGYELEPGDLGLVDPVRRRAPFHREA